MPPSTISASRRTGKHARGRTEARRHAGALWQVHKGEHTSHMIDSRGIEPNDDTEATVSATGDHPPSRVEAAGQRTGVSTSMHRATA